MKKLTVAFLILLFCNIFIYSQIVIDRNDMPDVDDTIRTSSAIFTSVDYSLTGQNYTWDFSGLKHLSQEVEKFVSIYSTPLVYNIVFIYPTVATIASPSPDISIIPTMSLTNVYEFYKETNSSFSMVGYGAYLNAIPVPVKYDNPDVLYNFPVTYGTVDSSSSAFSMGLPSIGYFGESVKRINTVDGWGTLITPYGTFQTIRIKSEVDKTDTIFFDSLGIGINLPSITIEYKWLAKGFGIPVLQINKSVSATTITYIDSVRKSAIGINEITNKTESFTVFPNPCKKEFSIKYNLSETSSVKLNLYTMIGKRIKNIYSITRDEGNYNDEINISKFNLPPGMYIIELSINNRRISKPLLIQ